MGKTGRDNRHDVLCEWWGGRKRCEWALNPKRALELFGFNPVILGRSQGAVKEKLGRSYGESTCF